MSQGIFLLTKNLKKEFTIVFMLSREIKTKSLKKLSASFLKNWMNLINVQRSVFNFISLLLFLLIDELTF